MRKSIMRAVSTLCAAAVLSGAAVLPASAAPGSGVPVTGVPVTKVPFPGMTAVQILAKANKDMTTLRSVHVYAKINGQVKTPAGTQEITSTISETLAQHGCLASLSLPGIGSVTLLSIGKNAWLKPDDSFWKGLGLPDSELAAVSGKWLDLNALTSGMSGSDKKELSCSLRVIGTAVPRDNWTRGRVVRSHGIEKLALNYRHKKDRETIVVSVARKPLLLSDVATNPALKDREVAYYGNFNAAITLTAPPPADVLTQLPNPGDTTGTDLLPQVLAMRSLGMDGLVIR